MRALFGRAFRPYVRTVTVLSRGESSFVASEQNATTAPPAVPAAPPPSSSLEIGAIRAALEADYDVLDELGRGGMAVVYRAREKELDREVAIKVLPAAMTFDNAFVERFQREARTAGQLEHPSIVPIYRVGRAGNVIFFVMKFLRGQSIATVLRERGKLPASDVRQILLDTASALGYAAKKGVVHRDIKPDNILLDHDGRCVVTDFGIAKTATGPHTAAGTSMGTPRYMSPEHAQGNSLDGRSDMYSLGIVAYQCLTGTIPFDGEDPFAVLYKHINAPLPRPELATDEERVIFAVIERMLAKKPEDRYQTADEMIDALGGRTPQTTLVGSMGSADFTSPTEIMTTGPLARLLGKLPRGRRLWIDLAGLAAIAVLGYFAVARGMGSSTGEAAATRQITTPPRAANAANAAPGSQGAPVPPAGTPDTSARLASGSIVGPPAPLVAEKPKPKPPPEKPSNCPRLSAAKATGANAYKLLVDSVRAPLKVGASIRVGYDVCGLPAGSPYTADITVRRTSRGRLGGILGGKVEPKTEKFVENAAGPRSKTFKVIDIGAMPAGSYWLDVAIMDSKKRPLTMRREFQIVEK
jgi:hypothetical protein